MLNIYYGGENIEKEKFIFEHIKADLCCLYRISFPCRQKRDAFFYLQKKD